MSLNSWLLVVGMASAVVGFAFGRWWTVLVPVVGWPLFYGGLAEGWWLYGVGDGWQHVAVMTSLVSTVGTLVGVAVKHAIPLRTPTRDLSRRPNPH